MKLLVVAVAICVVALAMMDSGSLNIFFRDKIRA